jgi:formate-dependent nitrite reductase cytochrome c552 subunit
LKNLTNAQKISIAIVLIAAVIGWVARWQVVSGGQGYFYQRNIWTGTVQLCKYDGCADAGKTEEEKKAEAHEKAVNELAQFMYEQDLTKKKAEADRIDRENRPVHYSVH